MPSHRDVLVEMRSITMNFGGVAALAGVTVAVYENETLGLIGPNGSGKTTLLNVLSGVMRPSGGDLYIRGEPVPFRRLEQTSAEQHFARTFQNIRLCRSMSVLDNVLIGAHKEFPWYTCLLPDRFVTMNKSARNYAEEMLSFVGWSSSIYAIAGDLSYGDQRRVEIARALMAKPQLLLLDEPAAGMNVRESATLVELLQRLKHLNSMTIMVIEHDMSVMMSVADRLVVLDAGRVLAQGAPTIVANDPAVQTAYLGKGRSRRD